MTTSEHMTEEFYNGQDCVK